MTRTAASALAAISIVLLVLGSSGAFVGAVPESRHEVVDEVGVGGSPRGIAANPVTNLIYVANSVDVTVYVVKGTCNVVIGIDPVGDGRK